MSFDVSPVFRSFAATLCLTGACMLRAAADEVSSVPSHDTAKTPVKAPAKSAESPGDTLVWLMAGNDRFAKGEPLHPHQSVARRLEVAKEQKPFAIVLGCSDSRVPPEICFDQGLGDLFVIRNAGEVLDAHVVGSIEYAVDHLHTPLLLVMGHQNCGAVSAAVGGGVVDGHVWDIVQSIKPAVQAVRGLPGDAVDNTVRMHARLTAQALRTSGPVIADAVKEGRLLVKAARYDLVTGRVEILPDLPNETPPTPAKSH